MKHIKKISEFFKKVNEDYTYENFTTNDMQMVKELYNDGMTDIKQIAIEMDLPEDMIRQILYSLKKSNQIDQD